MVPTWTWLPEARSVRASFWALFRRSARRVPASDLGDLDPHTLLLLPSRFF